MTIQPLAATPDEPRSPTTAGSSGPGKNGITLATVLRYQEPRYRLMVIDVKGSGTWPVPDEPDCWQSR